jgi:hypothetical protein
MSRRPHGQATFQRPQGFVDRADPTRLAAFDERFSTR